MTKETKKQIEQKEREKVLTELKEMFKGDDSPVCYTIVKHVSNTGMLRHIDVIYIKNNEPINLNWYIEKLGTYKRAASYNAKNADSLRVGGCGMDVGFAVVYGLSNQIFNDGYKINQRWL